MNRFAHFVGPAGLAFLVALASYSCSKKPESELSSTVASAKLEPVKASPYPMLGFNPRPSYLPTNAISLTFDDGPDPTNTPRVLDILKAHNVKATFFINADNKSNLMDLPAQELVKRIVNEGHELASHTDHHIDLSAVTVDEATMEQEILTVEKWTKQILGEKAGRLSLLRVPYGRPYKRFELEKGIVTPETHERVARVVARHAVHIGWNIDSWDWMCVENPLCVTQNVVSRLEMGEYGIVLLHSIHAQTADALPAILDYLKSKKYEFWTVEKVVQQAYGRSSAQLAGTGPCAGVPAYVRRKPYNVGSKVVFEEQLFTAINERNPGFISPRSGTWYWEAGPKCD